MLEKKSSKLVINKQSMMPDFSLPSPSGTKYSRPATLLGSPKNPFVGFSPKFSSDSEAAMSPTSLLETKPFFTINGNPSNAAVGLGGIFDALRGDESNPFPKSPKPESRMVLFGSRLKIQISSISPNSPRSPTPIEFGAKNKDSQLALLSPALRSPVGPETVLPSTEMEMSSEDYTCVIAHGPNPRTTHIFNNYIVEGNGFVNPKRENRLEAEISIHPELEDFLAFCYACKKKLGQGTDFFMYRGEKAFCSSECRYQEMLFDEGIECRLSESSALR